MNSVDQEYFRLLDTILTKGRRKKNRTGVDTIGVFGEQAKFEVSDMEFPILTTKKVWFKGILHELLWFIRGDTNIKYLVDNDVHIWDEWAYKRYTEQMKDYAKQTPLHSQSAFIEAIKTSDKFATVFGNLGEGTYGGMWRKFPYAIREIHGQISLAEKDRTYLFEKSVDQLSKIIDKLHKNPDDRRMIVSAWHPYWVDHCALPPCHCLFHFNTEEMTLDERFDYANRDGGLSDYPEFFTVTTDEEIETWLNGARVPKRKLNLLLYQRSCDTFLGVPFNITSYSLLLALVAQCVGMAPGTFTHTYGDLHIYDNHIEQVKLQMSREPKKLPSLWINPEKWGDRRPTDRDLFSFKYEDVKLVGYDPHPKIEAPIAV